MRYAPKRQLWMTVGGIVVVLLAAAVFTLGSLTLPLHLEEGTRSSSFSRSPYSFSRRCSSFR